MNILLVEDNAFFSGFYRKKLTAAGFVVSHAKDGVEAFSALEKSLPDLIILDLIMPNKDGFEVLEELKASDKYKKIPVIALSALSQKEDVQKAKELGARDYFDKNDTNIEDLIKKINQYK